LDSLELERALAEARYDDDVKEQVRWARWSGVTGIPTFIFNQRYALIGAQPYDVLKAAAQRASNAGPGPAVSLD
ncbi:MAG TPA: DsbA family protein, partial [Dehalococcoidia bacterium]|nr:DsbA family protein [Dehalococcoidia bacterium]